jgi:hypothetical protein
VWLPVMSAAVGSGLEIGEMVLLGEDELAIPKKASTTAISLLGR